MGNSLGGKKSTKVMKISGETFKLKTPVRAEEVVKDYPGHVLLESEAVKHFGIRAKPLQPHQSLEPKRLYFLVDLPANVGKEKVPRRVQSGINMSAKDRLESLMLSRRSVSDLSIMKPIASMPEVGPMGTAPPQVEKEKEKNNNGTMRTVRMMLPKAEVEKLMKGSKNKAEVTAKIVDLCMGNTSNNGGGVMSQQQMHWKGSSNGRIRSEAFKTARERRVSFQSMSEGGSQIAVVAS